MKQKKLLFPACLLIVVIIFVIVFAPKVIGSKPFAKLSENDISAVTVRLLPPDQTAQVVDIKEFVDVLNEVVIYEKDDSFTEYEGQAVIYTITRNDGTETVVQAYNPFIIIDGVGYKTKYEPCERLSHIANRLIK